MNSSDAFMMKIEADFQSTEGSIPTSTATLWTFRNGLSWLSLFIVAFGLMGNSVSLVVLTRPSMKSSINVFLSSMCVSSFFALLGLLVISVSYDLAIFYQEETLQKTVQEVYPYVYPMTNTFQMASILLTVCVSVNQFICVFRGRASTSSTNARKKETECRDALAIVILVYVLSGLFCVPYWLMFRLRDKTLEFTELGQNVLFKEVVHFWMYLPVAYIMPFSVLIFTNSYLLGKIMAMRKNRKHLLSRAIARETGKPAEVSQGTQTNNGHNHQSDDDNNSALLGEGHDEEMELKVTSPKPVLTHQMTNTSAEGNRSPKSFRPGGMNITIMLVAVVCLFFICQFPNLILHLFEGTLCANEPDTCHGSIMLGYWRTLAKFLLICNQSFNFACYCCFSQRFRSVMNETFKSC
nr:G protein-coupled receptor [Proales similis]